MGNIIRTPEILNTLGGTGDVTVTGNYMEITGLTDQIFMLGGSANGGVQFSRTETPNVVIVTCTGTASVLTSIIITQYNRTTGSMQDYIFQYMNPSSGNSATDSADGIRDAINAQNVSSGVGSLNVYATGTSTLILTGGAGDPMFTVQALSQCTASTTSGLINATNIKSCTAASPAVFETNAAHGYVVGQTITITVNDPTQLNTGDGTYLIVDVPNTTHFILSQLFDNTLTVDANGDCGSGGTLVVVPQAAIGTYNQIAALNPKFGIPVYGAVYSTLVWNGIYQDSPELTKNKRTLVEATVYFKQGVYGDSWWDEVVEVNAQFTTAGVLS